MSHDWFGAMKIFIVLASRRRPNAAGRRRANRKRWKDQLSHVDYAVVAVAISALIAWLIRRGRRAAQQRRRPADT